MINSQDIKMGTCIRMDGKLFFVIDFLHVKPGKGNTFMRVKLKNVVDGRVLERRFDISEKLEDVRVERRPYQYLYMLPAYQLFLSESPNVIIFLSSPPTAVIVFLSSPFTISTFEVISANFLKDDMTFSRVPK